MQKHDARAMYFLIAEKPIRDIPLILESGCPVAMPKSDVGAPGLPEVDPGRAFRFGRMFEKAEKKPEESFLEMLGLIELGMAMNAMPGNAQTTVNPAPKDDSEIPSGYTYLGQFISHEITFDKTASKGVPTNLLSIEEIIQGRSPSLDLDSLYGRGPDKDSELYEDDGIHLRVGTTVGEGLLTKTFDRDLYRGTSLFRVDDFADAVSLAQKLQSEADPLSQYLDSQLSSETRQLAQQCATTKQSGKEFLTALADDLNTLLKSASLFDPARFKQVALSDETNRLLGNASGNLIRLNRLLLEDGYPLEIKKSRRAIIADPRNDDNLLLSQTHVAFIQFHNKVVEDLSEGQMPEGLDARQALFNEARARVIRHFQWIVLEHYLPRILDEKVLNEIKSKAQKNIPPKLFPVTETKDLFMPVEFSVAAFRLGHSMIRDAYEWNYYHNSSRPASGHLTLAELLQLTKFSGDLEGENNLRSEWIIDWRRFYDFSEIGKNPHNLKFNKAKKIDPTFNFQLNKIPHYPHNVKRDILRPITVRNLLRGFALQLPTGQAVEQAIAAKYSDMPPPLTADEIADGPHKDVIRDYGFDKNTPLWYYILKEAELQGKGNRLGAVGSHIVAATLIGIMMNSDFSILKDGWTPTLGGRRAECKFDMMDMLDYAGVTFAVDED